MVCVRVVQEFLLDTNDEKEAADLVRSHMPTDGIAPWSRITEITTERTS